MLKYYAVITNTDNDEWTEYEGVNLKEAKQAYNRAKLQTAYNIEIREYELPDDTDINDRDELVNAICDAIGYNLIEM